MGVLLLFLSVLLLNYLFLDVFVMCRLVKGDLWVREAVALACEHRQQPQPLVISVDLEEVVVVPEVVLACDGALWVTAAKASVGLW